MIFYFRSEAFRLHLRDRLDFGQDMVRKALSQSKGNVEIAIDLLLTGQIQSTQNST